MSRPGDPKVATLKSLFALSCTRCAYQDPATGKGCEEILARPNWPRTIAEVAHIRGESAGSARFEPSIDPEQRRDASNIILLCPTHHKLIDDVERERHTVEILQHMKEVHEQRCLDSAGWAAEEALANYASLVLEFQFGISSPNVIHEVAGATDSLSGPVEERHSFQLDRDALDDPKAQLG